MIPINKKSSGIGTLSVKSGRAEWSVFSIIYCSASKCVDINIVLVLVYKVVDKNNVIVNKIIFFLTFKIKKL